MAYNRGPANGKPKLSPLLEARLMVSAETMKMTGSQALTDAAERWIKWADQTAPRQAFKTARQAFDAGRTHKSPDPVDYGLPPDHGIPAPRA